MQGVHVLEDVGDTELAALAGGETLRTVKIINKEVRLGSRIAKAGTDRLAHALTTVSPALTVCLACIPAFVLVHFGGVSSMTKEAECSKAELQM